MVNILIFLLIFGLYLLIYNLGMYVPAKVFGVRVEKFHVWFSRGFSIFKRIINETEFGLGWVPLGGYLKFSGMNLRDNEIIQPHDFDNLSIFKQIIVLFGGPIFSLIIGLVIYAYISSIALQKIAITLISLLLIMFCFFLVLKLALTFTKKTIETTKTKGILIYLVSVALYLGTLLIFFKYLNEIFPIQDRIDNILSENLNFYFFSEDFSTQNLKILASSVGIFFFLLNLLPIGTVMGFKIINAIYNAFTGVKVSQKFEEYATYISFPIVLIIYGWIFYHLIY